MPIETHSITLYNQKAKQTHMCGGGSRLALHAGAYQIPFRVLTTFIVQIAESKIAYPLKAIKRRLIVRVPKTR